jgi:aminoglycoside 3-N-acetyltransferase I
VNPSVTTCVLGATDIQLLRSVLEVFAGAFEDHDSYLSKPPSNEYLSRLLSSDTFVAIAAVLEGQAVGGLAGYTLHKFEQERSEFYIYDLAVKEDYRRQGIATALIRELQSTASHRGIYVIFVQADHGDDPAVALYSKLGTREDVMHFDIVPPHGAA